jgi:hypothetical protein
LDRVVWPRDEIRNLATFVLGYKGSGKSRFLGRQIAFQDLWRGIPQVIIDPAGGTLQNLLDCVMRAPPPHRRALLARLRYFDMSGKLTGRVCPLPLYYRFGSETWNDLSSRYIRAILTLDPDLTSASIMGANAILRVGGRTGMVLAALGAQISEAGLLLDKPQVLKPRLKQLRAEADDWGLRDALDFFVQDYMGWDSKKRSQETGSFRGKYNLLLRDNPSVAMFGASAPGIDFNQVLEEGHTICLDFSGDQQNPELLQFKMLWSLYYVMNFIKYRGIGLRHKPLGLIVDEISILSSYDAKSGAGIFEAEIDELYNIWARQGSNWPTMATQEAFQLSERLFKTLMGSGTVMVGRTSDMEAAVKIAKELMDDDPERRVKRYDPVYNSQGEQVARRRVDLSLEEKYLQDAKLFKNQPKLHFLVRQYGDGRLRPYPLYELDPGVFPDEGRVAELRGLLCRRCGVPIEQLLSEIEARQSDLVSAANMDKKGRSKPAPGCDTLSGDGQTGRRDDHLPETDTGEGEDDLDDLWTEATPQNP